MKDHLWVWVCAGLASGLVTLVALGGVAERAWPGPTPAPWPATTAATTPEGAPTARSAGGVAPPMASPLPTLSGRLDLAAPAVRLEGAAWRNGTVAITFTVQTAPGDCLFQPPFLQVNETRLPATAASLKAARMALLSLAAGGEARASLRFDGAPASGSGIVVFNPGSPADSLVAPRLDIAVTWPMTSPVTASPRKP